jgi:hypothetical protein
MLPTLGPILTSPCGWAQGSTKDLHSGVFGGTVHEPMVDLVKVLGTLVDPKGHILIPGTGAPQRTHPATVWWGSHSHPSLRCNQVSTKRSPR